MTQALPANRARFSLAEVGRITNGTLQGAADARVEGVVTDSRGDVSGRLFVALTGERYDGHAFVEAAVAAGAHGLLLERDVGDVPVPTVRVASTADALLALAAAQRRRFAGRVLAVAGSAGKTTTRSAISLLLTALCPGAVHFSPGNFNNRIGVPLVLLGLSAEHRLGVLEVGTNHPGEVAELTQLVAPDISILTLIGLEHTEGLGTLDDIEIEEGSALRELDARSVALANVDDERVARQLANSPSRRRVGYGFGPAAAYRVLERRPGKNGGSELRIARPAAEPLALHCGLLGRAGAYAVACAIAAAEIALDRALLADEVADVFAHGAEAGRLSPLLLTQDVLLLDDTYNSNPASLSSSVAAAAELGRLRGGRLVLVLGEMRELGSDSARLHREAAAAIADCGAELVFGIGGDAQQFLPAFAERAETCFAEDAESAALPVADRVRDRDVVLIKASRGVRAERVVAELVRRRGASA